MPKHVYMYFQFLSFLVCAIIVGCNPTERNDFSSKEQKDGDAKDNTMIKQDESLIEKNNAIDSLEILVVQCANGYEYEMHNYNFNSTIENELKKFENFKVLKFPYKKLKDVNYQGVFDKQYCPPIIDKVEADVLILTRFDKRFEELNASDMRWGYELKLIETKTLKEINSISAHNLKEYDEIEKHIKVNIEKLKTDIETL